MLDSSVRGAGCTWSLPRYTRNYSAMVRSTTVEAATRAPGVGVWSITAPCGHCGALTAFNLRFSETDSTRRPESAPFIPISFRIQLLMACALYTRSATRRISPRERNSLLASETFFPTRFGMETSRPWIAMRIALIALKNAADARINTSSSIRNIHSSRSRKFISDVSFLLYPSVEYTCHSERSEESVFAVVADGLHPGSLPPQKPNNYGSKLFIHQRRRRIVRQLFLP